MSRDLAALAGLAQIRCDLALGAVAVAEGRCARIVAQIAAEKEALRAARAAASGDFLAARALAAIEQRAGARLCAFERQLRSAELEREKAILQARADFGRKTALSELSQKEIAFQKNSRIARMLRE